MLQTHYKFNDSEITSKTTKAIQAYIADSRGARMKHWVPSSKLKYVETIIQQKQIFNGTETLENPLYGKPFRVYFVPKYFVNASKVPKR